MKLLDTKGAAAKLDLKPGTLETWRTIGGGPRFVKVGRYVRYSEQSIEEFIAQNELVSTTQAQASRGR